MERQKRWQRFIILGALVLTFYNILPTVFYYTKPLKSQIDLKRAETVATGIAKQVNVLEKETGEWLHSFCKLLKVKPISIKIDQDNPQFFRISFKNTGEANLFRKYFPRAGQLISFVPKQLFLYEDSSDRLEKTVTIQRNIPIRFKLNEISQYFQYSKKFDPNHSPTNLYRSLIFDRALQIGLAVGGTSENSQIIEAIITNPLDPLNQDLSFRLMQNILSFSKAFGESSEIAKRYFSSYTQTANTDPKTLWQNFTDTINQLKDQLKIERIALQSEAQALQSKGEFLEIVKQQRLQLLIEREKIISNVEPILKKNQSIFSSGTTPLNNTSIMQLLEESYSKINFISGVQEVNLENRNPFIKQLIIDWKNEKIDLFLYEDLLSLKKQLDETGQIGLREQIDQFIYNEIAYDSRQAGEEISPLGPGFQIALDQLQGSDSFLAMRLSEIAKNRVNHLKETISHNWHPKHPDLAPKNFPIWDYETYLSLPAEQRQLGLIVYAPALNAGMPDQGFRMNSIYLIAKGFDKILQKHRTSPNSSLSQTFFDDFNSLKTLLQKNGLFGYPASSYIFGKKFVNDFIFEGQDYFQIVLKATREDFSVHGTKRYAVLEFSDVEQRILTENKIDNRIHEDLLKWRDDFRAAQLGMRGTSKYDIPHPTQNVFFSNLKLSFKKYFRGDERKILHWGLDLSGGKTIQLELKDISGKTVTNESDIKQAINELYRRVNKMGVSEVSIRQEGKFITLDFPGSQNLSAQDLVKASSMYFHVVNEKFNEHNPALAEISDRFLQEIWNEAIVTGRKSSEEINAIAWRHLHGDSFDPDVVQPTSESGKILYENGLRLTNPIDVQMTSNFNDQISQIAVQRGDDYISWHGKSHPLMIVFRNYALEGSNLKNVQASYDPSKGNFLGFEIKSSYTSSSGQKYYPRDDLYAWTSQFSKEKIIGTQNANYSKGSGWRMAVILNGTIISSPTLDYPIKDNGSISGSFSQREVNQLESDLKAGSLSFTPRILSEKNVSPELGSHERVIGILATIIALILVIFTMIGYYRFAGLIASCAVILNLFVMWATLQNLSATLTLASIAGIILTVGMAVDANVLVFERIREEFALSGRIASAIQTGYRKAFSAIVDSNVTTIIAALILLNFDSGPIKGFAVTLIIGIVSSMFTALFMTRYYFNGWIQNPEHKSLKMAHLIKSANFDFLKFGKVAFIASLAIILVGGIFLFKEKSAILGMDFTGGYSLNLEVVANKDIASYRTIVEKALEKAGITGQEFQVRELTPSNNLRIFLSKIMDKSGRPFFEMPFSLGLKDYTYSYEDNPRINWVATSLSKANVTLTKKSLENLSQNWNEVSGQLSDAMRNSALIGLGLALLAILIYITLRFEFKYAAAATLCLAHDVVLTVTTIAILRSFQIPVQIDLNTIAALMTIVGYSLNDTIIVFDRIREDIRHMRKLSFKEIINHALNVTLSRTMMTSGITFLVLLPLVLLGGSTIFGFALVMIIGIIFGTLSSLFIAAPLLHYFHVRHLEKSKPLPQVVV
ncbi:MAG: protein translocase subunit SecD [Chlamydiae bacterium]|nr:protein translocase subunit SecD [Chlamydiota bacterium]